MGGASGEQGAVPPSPSPQCHTRLLDISLLIHVASLRTEVLPDGFSCPNETQVHTNGQALDHTRHLKPSDCRFFYICNEGKYPHEVGCPQGTVFNDATLNCDDPRNVPGW